MATTTRLTKAQTAKATAIVAEALGPMMGYDGPAPVGPEHAYVAAGPQFVPDWEGWSGGERPTLLLEGGPEDWPVVVSARPEVVEALRAIGVFAEPYSCYALCFYPA